MGYPVLTIVFFLCASAFVHVHGRGNQNENGADILENTKNSNDANKKLANIPRLLEGESERYLIKCDNTDGRKAALAAAKIVYHDFHEDGYVAVELDSAGLTLLEFDENVGTIELDSVWKEDGILEQVIDADKIDEFFSNSTNRKRHLTERHLAAGEQIPYGITMVQGDKVPYGKNRAMVCIVDTGIFYSHPDFNQKGVSGASRKASANAAQLFWNVDKRGHGTHIAGTVAARANNNYGVRGMGNIPLYITRGLGDDGTARESDIREAMGQCEQAGAKVISLSLSGHSMTNLLKAIIDRLYSKNILIIAAAGNDGKREGNFPASYNKVVSAGAVEKDESRWKGSNYGPWLELAAPGAGILSTGFTYTGQPTFVVYSGTSMATPHIAGAAALLWSNFPSCTVTQIRYVLARTAKDKGTKGCDDYYGYGIVQTKVAYNFLKKNSCRNASWGKSVGDGTCSILNPKKRNLSVKRLRKSQQTYN